MKQAPDNLWMIIQDTERFGIKKTLDGKITVVPDPSKNGLGRITKVVGEIIYLKQSNGFVPYLKISGNKTGNYPYVPVKDLKTNKLVFEPYYAWVIRNEKDFTKENPELLSTAKSKMGSEEVALIQSDKYTYAFDASNISQIEIENSNSELIDNIRYSISGDSRDLFRVIKNNAPVFMYDKNNDIVVTTGKRLDLGAKVRGIGKIRKEFRYKLPKMLNYDENIYIPIRYLKKIGSNDYEVNISKRPIKILNGKITPLKNDLNTGTVLSGNLKSPIVDKDFSFIILSDDKERTFFMKRNHLQEMISDSYLNENDQSNFEGGDIEDFYGGDVNFSGTNRFSQNISRADLWSGIINSNAIDIWKIDGSEKVIGFDSNIDIPKDEFDNTQMYFNMDSNEKVLGNFYDNSKIDLSFDSNNNEEISNAFGDFFKKIFKNKKTKNIDITPDVAKELANKDKVEYTPEEVELLYENSRTKKTFRDWLKSDESKQLLNNLSKLGYQLLLNKIQNNSASNNTQNIPQNYNSENYNNPNYNKDDDKKIFGMHPITFGVFASTTILVIGFGIYFIAKKK